MLYYQEQKELTMRYAFVSFAIVIVWVALILMALITHGAQATMLYMAALFLTLVLFLIGFRRR